MSHIGELGDIKRPLSGWLSLVLFVLMIPLTNWVIMNVGLVCPADGPCLIPVWPGLWAPSGVLLAGFSLVLRDVVHHCLGLALGADFDFCRRRALGLDFGTRSGHCFGLCFLVCGAR